VGAKRGLSQRRERDSKPPPTSEIPLESPPIVPAGEAPEPSDLVRGEPQTSDDDIEGAIVAAMLDGRGAVAELLAERLRERRHARAGNVLTLRK
jgi:hypothetical protein